ncbi:uncharacterized protein LOC128176318 [Crassostrea angulata]|uniref:uncharacterized protein LOC128176318 n=1 Tax=Magallana angulata TaxID=2784310 RepID=UPI0022B0869C|nr:uncharacterized protein LOC128176318 [Crassostrea angulata]
MDKTKLSKSYIKTLEDQSKPVPNDNRQERYCKYITKFASHFGNERVILTGSTIKRLRLRSHKDEGDFDYLIISGITIPEDALEQRKDLPCFVHIRTDKLKTSFSKSLIVDGKYLHSKVLKEFEVTKEGFPITSGLKPILTAPKISKGRHSKHLEINLEAKPGTSQIHYSIRKTDDLDPEILSVIDEEDDAGNFQSAVRSSNLSTDMKDILCNLVSKLVGTVTIDTALSMLFQTLSGLLISTTSSENSMPPSKRICKRESETDSDHEKVYRVPYLYKSSKDFIAAFPLVGNPSYLENWKQRMMSRKGLFWPKQDTIENICNAELYVVAKPAIVDPNSSIDFCLGFNQAEHILAKSFSPDQKLCLLLLKSLQKGFLESYSDTLTTFHWNNAFYHKCGEINPSLFDRHSTILVALGNVLSYMAKCLENGYLQHYFIESNLLAHISKEKANEIAAKIKEILQDPERTMEVYFEKKPTDQICLISKKDLKRAKESWNQLHQAGNIIGTWSANDDSTLQNALLDTLQLVLKTDFQGEGSVSEDSPGTSTSGESQIGQLLGEGLRYYTANFSNRQERKRAEENLISKAVVTVFSSILRK